jgi:hypothetical protein
MNTTDTEINSLRRAAFVAGLAILIMALTVPIVEFYIFPKLIDYKNGEQTTKNIATHTTLFSTAIFIHFITVICDIVSGWALYIFLRPVNRNVSLLTAWFRLVNTAFTIAALLNLIQILALIRAQPYFTAMEPGQIHDQILYHLRSFNLQWRFMLVFFGIYMNLLGYLLVTSTYVPKLIGICVIIAGLGYLVDDLKYFFYPNFDTGFLWFTFFGELVFMFWLLIKGSRIADVQARQ